MTDNERKMTVDHIETISLEYEKIDTVIKQLQNIKKKLGGNTTIYHGCVYNYDETQYYYVRHMRPETDSEMASRIYKEELQQKERVEWQRKQYEHLKKQFEQQEQNNG